MQQCGLHACHDLVFNFFLPPAFPVSTLLYLKMYDISSTHEPLLFNKLLKNISQTRVQILKQTYFMLYGNTLCCYILVWLLHVRHNRLGVGAFLLL